MALAGVRIQAPAAQGGSEPTPASVRHYFYITDAFVFANTRIDPYLYAMSVAIFSMLSPYLTHWAS